MEKIIEEINRMKKDKDPMLDKKCIGLYNTMVVFLETKEKMNLSESYFKDKNSCFDPSFAGCYITPGRVATLREIHINALKSELKNLLIQKYYSNASLSIEEKEICSQYIPDVLATLK